MQMDCFQKTKCRFWQTLNDQWMYNDQCHDYFPQFHQSIFCHNQYFHKSNRAINLLSNHNYYTDLNPLVYFRWVESIYYVNRQHFPIPMIRQLFFWVLNHMFQYFELKAWILQWYFLKTNISHNTINNYTLLPLIK